MGRALGIGIVLAPFISALLLSLGWAGRALTNRYRKDHLTMRDSEVRTILHPHRDGGPISRLHDTGEIGTGLAPALTQLAAHLYADDRDEDCQRIEDVIQYVRTVGGRPPVTGWLNRT